MKSAFPWHDDAVKQLSLFLRRQSLMQTLLFYGQDGLGIDEFMMSFLANLLAIAREDVDKYLYLEHLDPLEQKVSVDYLRQLQARLKQTVRDDKPKIIVINHVGALNIACANALLKILEEPPNATFFLLQASSLSEVLPTIVSRCLKIFFRSATFAEFQNYFGDVPYIKEHYRLSNGAPLKIREWQNSGFLDLFHHLKNYNLYKISYSELEKLVAQFKPYSFSEIFLLFESLLREKLNVKQCFGVNQSLFQLYEFILQQKAFYNKQYHLNKERFVGLCLTRLIEIAT